MILQDVSTLKELEHLREEWASIVAHDLQQPINAIVLWADLLLRAGLADDRNADVRQIRTAAKQLSRMVSDLMDASQLETHRLPVNLERLDLGENLPGLRLLRLDRWSRGRRPCQRQNRQREKHEKEGVSIDWSDAYPLPGDRVRATPVPGACTSRAW